MAKSKKTHKMISTWTHCDIDTEHRWEFEGTKRQCESMAAHQRGNLRGHKNVKIEIVKL